VDLARKYLNEKRFSHAIPLLEELLKEAQALDKEEQQKVVKFCFQGLATCFLKESNFAECVKYCDRWVEEFPNDSAGYHQRGLAKVRLDDFDGAERDFKVAIEQNPTDKDVERDLSKLKQLFAVQKQDQLLSSKLKALNGGNLMNFFSVALDKARHYRQIVLSQQTKKKYLENY
jgi:regulator of sirC expression with transglutaminase-like and TPR domain